jgi:tellurite resistance-related uncharacterized protein
MSGAPYKVTPVFDERSLPAGLRRDHETKPGVWGVIRVLEGRLRLVMAASGEETVLTPEQIGLVLPAQRHFVEPLGRMRMQVEFHHSPPSRETGTEER